MTGVGALKGVQIPHDHLKRVLSKFIHEQSMVAIMDVEGGVPDSVL